MSVPPVCSIVDEVGRQCPEPVDGAAPLNLCTHHLVAAHDWVAGDVGVTDTLPSPCQACGSRLGVRYPSGWLCAICEWKVGDIPDEDIAERRVDVVYYLRFGDRIKIGTSSNPRMRLASQRYEQLLAFERGTRAVEQRRHAQFAEFRILRTEWFDISESLLRHIDVLSAGVDDPWQQYARWVSERLALKG
ncbi:GIY-YIG nuclease family protein [Planctomonas psychrotolerans]|uniref:GIY-YIG nuclease family protein n=1 Tax=Planctomonas psychrotolerans TaxID=2528712 RepID=UPI0012392C99|nr:GIY-YIG nuclease family protein [Planctomonas psychrotolerans]